MHLLTNSCAGTGNGRGFAPYLDQNRQKADCEPPLLT